MEERNELNDIILNKTEQRGSNKKLLVAIATFAIILIIVVVVMNKLGSDSNASTLPHPPKKRTVVVEEVLSEPDYAEKSVPMIEKSIENISELRDDDVVVEEVDLIPENNTALEEPHYSHEKAAKPVHKKVSKPKAKPKPKPKAKSTRPSGKYNPKTKRLEKSSTASQSKPVAATKGSYYVQVGSFAKYAPSKKFLNKITQRGYTYTYHKVTHNGRTLKKVLVGPFKTKSAAREALPIIKRSVERGAFLTKI